MTAPASIVFLLDVDNTLLDNAVAQSDDGVPQLVEEDRDEEEKRRHEALRPVGGGGECAGK